MSNKKKVINDYRRLILQWNNDHPLDLWWRQKHKIAFGSETHLNMSEIDMRLEYEEEKLIEEVKNKDKPEEIVGNTGDKALDSIINMSEKSDVVKMKEDEIDHEFDNLDLNNI